MREFRGEAVVESEVVMRVRSGRCGDYIDWAGGVAANGGLGICGSSGRASTDESMDDALVPPASDVKAGCDSLELPIGGSSRRHVARRALASGRVRWRRLYPMNRVRCLAGVD